MRWFIFGFGFIFASMGQAATIYRYDMTHLYDLDRNDPAQAKAAWDEAHLVSSLQGIVNREEPVLLIRFMAKTDDFWFNQLRAPGNWLADREVIELRSLEELLEKFRSRVVGLVVYPEEPAAASNLASMIAGVEDRICLRYDSSPDSLYTKVMALNGTWENVRDLRRDGASWGKAEWIAGTNPPIRSTGSAKGDAYLWAKQNFLDKGKNSDEFLAYYIDSYWLKYPTLMPLENFTLTNHDFFISQRAFFFDLGVWRDEAPVDDPGQPLGTDRRVLESILERLSENAGENIIHIGGFTPWKWKYTDEAVGDSGHGAVATEWEKNKLASVYNAVIDSDALGLSGMANASFYQHFPLQEHYPQPARPTVEDLRKRGFIFEDGEVAPLTYVMFYSGDYDSAAWLNRHVPRWWKDPARGEIPINWAFNPNLDRRAPHALDFARRNQAKNEWFIAGDSGAGYLNPGMLSAENRGPGHGDGWAIWVDYCRAYFEKYDLTITGFVIDGASPGMGSEGMDQYMKFSPDGFIGQKIPSQGLHRDTMPFIRMGADFHMIGPSEAAAQIVDMVKGVANPRFMPLRSILKSPSWHKETMERVKSLEGGDRVRFLDAYSFMLLLKHYERDKLTRQAGPGPFSEAEELRYSFSRPSLGLEPVLEQDGPFQELSYRGRKALRQVRTERNHYLYFRTGDGFARAPEWGVGTDVVITVTLFDSAGGRIGLQYNAPNEPYVTAPETIALTGTGEWREIRFRVPNARFEHSQNAGASFRLVNLGTDLIVNEVLVRRN